jgi:hypothetical protein
MDWKYATNEILLIAIPTLVPLPYGKEIESTTFNDNFAEEMQNISSEHGFGAKSMANIIDQVETENHTEKVFNRIIPPLPHPGHAIQIVPPPKALGP